MVFGRILSQQEQKGQWRLKVECGGLEWHSEGRRKLGFWVLEEAVLPVQGLGRSCQGALEKKAVVFSCVYPGAGEGPLSLTLQLDQHCCFLVPGSWVP